MVNKWGDLGLSTESFARRKVVSYWKFLVFFFSSFIFVGFVKKIFRSNYLVLVCGLITQHYTVLKFIWGKEVPFSCLNLTLRLNFASVWWVVNTETTSIQLSSKARSESQVLKEGNCQGDGLNSYFTLFSRIQFKFFRYLNVEKL